MVNTLKASYSKIGRPWCKTGAISCPYRHKGAEHTPEVSFISNSEEEKRLRTPEYRQKIAEGLYDGIQKYISSSIQVAVNF